MLAERSGERSVLQEVLRVLEVELCLPRGTVMLVSVDGRASCATRSKSWVSTSNGWSKMCVDARCPRLMGLIPPRGSGPPSSASSFRGRPDANILTIGMFGA